MTPDAAMLSVPVHFAAPEDRVWPELRDAPGGRIAPQRLSELSGGILNSWVVRTYYELSVRGHDVSIGPTLDPGAVNVVPARDFGRRQRRLDCFILVPRGDAHHPMLADFVVHQNGVRPDGPRAASVWHWPQPGIVPRATGRAPRIATLVYKGRPKNLDAGFRAPDFAAGLAALGARFDIDEIATMTGGHSWNDYAGADAVLAVRNLTRYDASKKPASKLMNAWIAGVVPLLSPEPAFEELRRDPLDYIAVRHTDDALAAVARLNDDPALFERYVARGRERAAEIAEDRLSGRWVDVLNGPVATAFARWRRRGRLTRAAGAAVGMALEPVSKRVDLHRLRHGARILDPADQSSGPAA